MEKIVNINKAPKDDVLNKIMREIDDENVSVPKINPKKTKNKKQKISKQKPKMKLWKKWLLTFIFLIIIVCCLFVLMLILKATKEITIKKVVMIEKVEDNISQEIETTTTTPLTKVTHKEQKAQENLIIFDMTGKTTMRDIEQAPYIPLNHKQARKKPLSDHDKAKALLKEQMKF